MRKIKYMMALLVCAGIAHAGIITPTTVTYTGTAAELLGNGLDDETNIINGNGLAEALAPDGTNLGTVTHANVNFTDNAWTTTDPNGPASDFFSNNTATVIFKFDLGGTFTDIDTFVAWGYHFGTFNGNSASNVTLDFSTDGGLTVASSQTIAVPFAAAVNLATIVKLTPVNANFITMTVNDNHYGDVRGGDRVGISEIRFGSNLTTPVLPPSILSFSASPSTVTNGGTTTLSWMTANADTVSFDQGIGSVPASGSTQLVVNAETTYTLTATSAVGSTNTSATVTIQEEVRGIIIQPTALISEELVFNSAETTIDNTRMISEVNNGDSLTSALAAYHDFGSGYNGSYVSVDRNGVADFFEDGETSPVNLVYELTSTGDTALDGIVLWNYENTGGGPTAVGNHLRTVEVRVNTEADGSSSFNGPATTITLLPVTDGDSIATNDLGGVNSAQYFRLPAMNGRYVQLSLTDNYLGFQDITSGGDRVGFGEVRFVSGSGHIADPIGAIMISGPIAITGGQGMVISWDTSDGQEYNVQYKNNLIIDSDWTTFISLTGTGGGVTVTSTVDQVQSFYRVVTP